MTTKEKLVAWIKEYGRAVRGEKERFIVDEISTDFYLLLDCTDIEEPSEFPEAVNKCDVYIVSLSAEDWEAEKILIKSNADKYGIMRVFAALGIGKTKIKAM